MRSGHVIALMFAPLFALMPCVGACSATGLEHPSQRGASVAQPPPPSPAASRPEPARATPVTAFDALPTPSALSDVELAALAHADLPSLGTLSIGSPNRGALVNAVQMPEDPRWRVVDPAHAFGTPDAVASIRRAVVQVSRAYPDSAPLYIGQLSSPEGGRLKPHRSHQSGRDVDLGYYYRDGARWYARANAKNLDLPRTWALVKAFGEDPNVEAIFMDLTVQALLRKHALQSGEEPRLVDSLFARHRRDATRLVHHEWGHLTHLHVRFKSEAPTELGHRAHDALLALGVIPRRRYY